MAILSLSLQRGTTHCSTQCYLYTTSVKSSGKQRLRFNPACHANAMGTFVEADESPTVLICRLLELSPIIHTEFLCMAAVLQHNVRTVRRLRYDGVETSVDLAHARLPIVGVITNPGYTVALLGDLCS